MEDLVTLLCLLSSVHLSHQGLDQKRLLRDLFETRKYNVLERPAARDNGTVTVSIAFNLQQIINLDEREQYLDSSIWIEQYWTDAGLIWNPADYGGIARIRLAPTTIWRPDILMYNSANEQFDGTWPVNVIVQSNGFISYIPPAMLRSICKVNIKWFPFDEQFCLLKFGSWTYDDAQVNITLNSPSIISTDYIENGEFALVERVALRYDKPFYYAGVSENYPFVALCFHLQRLSLYYYFNLIIPAALISVMALLVFTLPVDSGEKMGLSVTILLSLAVFNMVIAEFIPRTSEAVPLLGTYFVCTMLICSVAIITSVWVLNLYYFPNLNENPPYWLRYGICFYLAKILRLTIPQEVVDSARLREAQSRVASAARGNLPQDLFEGFSKSLMANVLDMDDDDVLKAVELEPHLLKLQSDNSFPNLRSTRNDAHQDPECLVLSNGMTTDVGENENASGNGAEAKNGDAINANPVTQATGEKGEVLPSLCRNYAQFQRILKELKVLGCKVRGDANTDTIRVEWRFASRVIDRACLLVFSMVNILCTVFVLFSRPPESSDEHRPHDWPC